MITPRFDMVPCAGGGPATSDDNLVPEESGTPVCSTEEPRMRELLGNLLAVIHRDGGHYVEEHGWEQACAEAERRVLRLRHTGK